MIILCKRMCTNYTWNAVVTTSLDIERDEVRSKSTRRILGKQVNRDLVCDIAIILLYRLTAESTQQRVDTAVIRRV